MKNLIIALFALFAFASSAQDYTLLHINAKWNQSNDYDLRGIRHAKVQMAFLEDQNAKLDLDNRSFNYGDGLFETIRVINGKIMFWED